MDKRLRMSAGGTIRFLAVFVLILWLWNFFRSYLLFMVVLLMLAGVILSTAGLWFARDRIQAEIALPSHRIGKNTDVAVEIRILNPLRIVGFAIDFTYRWENIFTGSTEEGKEKLWAAPGKGGGLKVLLNSRYAGRLRVSVEEFRVYDLLHIFYLLYRVEKGSEVLAWPAFADGEDTEELYACIEGFPRENESRKRGAEYNPDYEIREYIPGDELKSIHWKLSAKQGVMMVRERLAAGREKINVLLPLGENLDENDALMESLYGMCRLLLSKEYPIQLFWQGVDDGLCSRCIMEPGELENVLGEILSIRGIHVTGSIEEQMSIEHSGESYILVKTGAYKGAYVSCQQEIKRLRGRHLISPDMITKKSLSAERDRRAAAGFLSAFHKKEKENTSALSLTRMQEKDKYDFFAALAKALILVLLVYGSVGGFLTAFEIAFHSSLCMLSLFALAFVLSVVYETGKRWLANLTILLVFLLYFYIAITNYWTINNGYYYILNCILDAAREYFDVSSGMEYSLRVEDGYMAATVFAIFLGMIGIILLNIQLHNKCTLFRAMLLTLTPHVIPMYFACVPPLLYIGLMLAGYGAVMMLSYGRGRVSTQVRYVLPAMAAVTALVVSAAAFLMPEETFAGIIPQSKAKEATRQGMEQVARYGMLALFPQSTAGSGISGGQLSKSSAIMPSYETALTVRYTPYSFKPVYLKAFTGLHYMGTSWTEADSEWPGDGSMEASLQSRYDAFREEGGDARQGCGTMEVERAEAEDTFEYRPYYTDHHHIERKDGTLIYHYYPDNGESVLTSGEEPYEGYLHVPESCETAVRQVCEEAGFGGTEQEIAGQIVTYFDENYNYTLRPGYYYGDPDYISHFLLESRRGYCAHFASAATMLFRQMGIPARYVEGYSFSYADVVENGELVEGAGYDAYYAGFSELGATALIQIEIPSAYAHAWVEIFDSERGWLVVDPTPSATEAETTSFWDVFMQREGEGTERTLGEDVLGGYIENVLGVVNYVMFATGILAAILFVAARMARKERERRLPGRERVKLAYRRLQRAAAKKNREFGTNRTLKEQIAWLRENCGVQISDEQEEALYQAFFAKDIDYDCDQLCRELTSVLRPSVSGSCNFLRFIVK